MMLLAQFRARYEGYEMARPQITPDKTTLRRYLEAGMTHQEIADLVNAEKGTNIGRSAIAAACSRYELSTIRPRYDEEIPWTVSEPHLNAYQAIMLRLLGRRRQKRHMSDNEARLLDSWLEGLKRDGLIVGYCPDPDSQGFYYIDKKFKDHNKRIPIRVKTLKNM